MSAKAALLAELARTVAAQSQYPSLPERLCRAAVHLMGAAGASLTIAYTTPHRVTLCSTDDRASRLEDLQDVLGQGPGPTAYASGHQIRSDIGMLTPRGVADVDARWPEFDLAVRDAFIGVRITAIAIHPDSKIMGVLTCHQSLETSPLLEEPIAQFLADAVGVALLQDPDTLATDLTGPWASRAQVHQATGMVTAQLHVHPEDALALLRAHAFAHGWTLARVAAAVVQRELDFTGELNEDITRDPQDGTGRP
ncbi:hypothetical protein ASH01_18065 [Terrabacter sp. Soil811]|uniref:ANTAR domain-containing protein n=1 Tax=Terrabacter sp. Soil811 TaxID=1736419 RepID=UPI0006F42E03|nr:ANTAR domain-containing protein [Terrabacter sp. Soil811]KRF41980.1 hypothetical protein ASH01_18065 [Terrabacter sp. Soil811]